MADWEFLSVEYEPSMDDEREFYYVAKARSGTKPTTEQLLRDMSARDSITYGLQPIHVTLTLMPDVHLGKFELCSVQIDSKDVNTTVLRSIPLQSLTEMALTEMAKRDWPGLRPMMEINDEVRGLWPKDKDRAAVFAAALYKAALLRALPPVEEVQKQFQVSRSTATRIIAHARKTGQLLIEPVHISKRKGNTGNGTEKTQSRQSRND